MNITKSKSDYNTQKNLKNETGTMVVNTRDKISCIQQVRRLVTFLRTVEIRFVFPPNIFKFLFSLFFCVLYSYSDLHSIHLQLHRENYGIRYSIVLIQ